jgi:hypothetical protein
MHYDLEDTQPITTLTEGIEPPRVWLEHPYIGRARVSVNPALIRNLEANGWRVVGEPEDTQEIEPVRVEVEYPSTGRRFATTLELARRFVGCGWLIRQLRRKE